jgi:hypothetical protein
MSNTQPDSNTEMTSKEYFRIKNELVDLGYGEEIAWQSNLKECDNNYDFAIEAVWVILNSGMKEQIARQISNRIYAAIKRGDDISTAFRHKGKVAAIKHVLEHSHTLFADYLIAENKIEFLQRIPFIGKITCYHLAKNLGHDCVKPDRHLVRVAEKYNTTPDALCEQISKVTGDRKCVIDIVIWRACNLKII